MAGLTICILAGGYSPERNVSLASAANVAGHLRRGGHQVTVLEICGGGPLASAAEAAILASPIAPPPPVDELAGWRARLDAARLLSAPELRAADAVFPLVHGAFGEDGRLQALLEAVGKPYVGSDWAGQALAMDKHLSKQLMAQNGVRTPPWRRLAAGTTWAEPFELPAVVMPAGGGSSVGMTVCRQAAELAPALRLAWSEDSFALVQRFIAGRELTLGMLGAEPLALGEIRAPSVLFDYEAKYRGGQTREIFPAEVPAAVREAAGEIGRRLMVTLRLRHYARMDFILDGAGQLWALEANAVPGMTAKSLYPQSAAAAGWDFAAICERLCRMAIGTEEMAESAG
ncbi:MAG: D-alanine--D-alanine ligase family protein [Terriglobales bacterium]